VNSLDDWSVTASATAAFIAAIAEPTRLRIVNCVAAAPLFVSDLVTILGLPQPTVSRHLRVLRDAGVLSDLPIPPYAIYSLVPQASPRQRVLRAVLDAALTEAGFRTERDAALARSRESVRARVAGVGADVG
jgi:ArsR family transcriptional regulator